MIRGELVNLRAVEREDAPRIHRWFNDPEVMRFWGAPASTMSVAEVQRRIENWLDVEARLDRPACFVIDMLDIDVEPIGLVILSEFRPADRSAELSVLLGERSRWGQGLGTDTLRAVLDACFNAWNLHRVWVRSEADNERAHRLYRRCGLTLEGTLRDATFVDGRYVDVLIFAILEGEPGDDASPGSP